MAEKNLGRLVPTKKLITNKKTGSINDETYYVSPEKPTPVKPLKKEEPNNVRKPGLGEPEPNTNNKETAPAEPVKNNPEEENLKNKNEPSSKDSTKLPTDFSNIKDFEDFGKHGIDPAAAKQFFCNM